MKHVTRSVLFVLASFALSPSAEPQQSATDRLQALAGTWDVTYEVAPGPSGSGSSGAGTMTSRMGPGGHSIVSDYTSTSGSMRGFKIHQVIAWDADEKVYDLVWVDSYSPGVVAAQGRPEGDGIAYSRESTRGDHQVVSKGIISEIEPGAFTITSYMSLDGGPDVRTMTLRYRRR